MKQLHIVSVGISLLSNLEVALNITGGFKAEAAILYSLGCELSIPVYYLHETYKVPITLPVCAVPF